MVDKMKGFFGTLPDWWPVMAACIWLIWSTATWHQEIIDKMNSQEEQIKAIQEYLRNGHAEKNGAEISIPGLSSNQYTAVPLNP